MVSTGKCSSGKADFATVIIKKRNRVKHSLTQRSTGKNIEDIEYISKSVTALIAIINDIWNRCKGYKVDVGEIVGDSRSFLTPVDQVPIMMKRVSYEEVQVKKHGQSLNVVSKMELSTHDFGPPPKFPTNLTNLIDHRPFYKFDRPYQFKGIAIMNYSSYLDKSIILCDEVLLPFLTTFLKHLQEMQVYLGKIETWLSESESRVKFLNDLFENENAKNGGIDEKQLRNSSGRVYWGKETCVRCFKPCKKHTLNQNKTKYLCKDDKHAKFFDPPKTTLYESTSFKDDGKIDMAFNLSTDVDKKKLQAMYSFLKIED